jgi:putative ABC transport system permease protein
VEPTRALANVRSLREVLGASLAQRRFTAALVGTCSLVALILAIIGLYGGISFVVGQRRREMGVRMALGARPAHAVGLILREGIRIITLGVAIGAVGSVLVTRLLRSQLVGVSTTEPAIYAAVLLLVVAVGVIACYIPAQRTSRVDPLDALRAE